MHVLNQKILQSTWATNSSDWLSYQPSSYFLKYLCFPFPGSVVFSGRHRLHRAFLSGQNLTRTVVPFYYVKPMHNSSTAVLNLIENHRIYPFYGQKCTQMCTLVCTIGTHTGNKPVVAIFKIEQKTCVAVHIVRRASSVLSLEQISICRYLREYQYLSAVPCPPNPNFSTKSISHKILNII